MESGIYIKVKDQDLDAIDIQFGGKVGIGLCVSTTEPKAIVVLQELNNSYKIGTDVKDKEYNPEDFNIKLVFDNVESINVLKKALNDAKLHILSKQAGV